MKHDVEKVDCDLKKLPAQLGMESPCSLAVGGWWEGKGPGRAEARGSQKGSNIRGVLLSSFKFLPLGGGSMSGEEGQIVNTSQRSREESAGEDLDSHSTFRA